MAEKNISAVVDDLLATPEETSAPAITTLKEEPTATPRVTRKSESAKLSSLVDELSALDTIVDIPQDVEKLPEGKATFSRLLETKSKYPGMISERPKLTPGQLELGTDKEKTPNQRFLEDWAIRRATRQAKYFNQLFPQEYQKQTDQGVSPFIARKLAFREADFQSKYKADTELFDEAQKEQSATAAETATKKVVSPLTMGALKRVTQTATPLEGYFGTQPKDLTDWYDSHPDGNNMLRTMHKALGFAEDVATNLIPFVIASTIGGPVSIPLSMVRSGAVFGGLTAAGQLADPEQLFDIREIGKQTALGLMLPGVGVLPGIGKIGKAKSEFSLLQSKYPGLPNKLAKLAAQSGAVGGITLATEMGAEALAGRSPDELSKEEWDAIGLNTAMMVGFHLWGGKEHILKAANRLGVETVPVEKKEFLAAEERGAERRIHRDLEYTGEERRVAEDRRIMEEFRREAREKHPMTPLGAIDDLAKKEFDLSYDEDSGFLTPRGAARFGVYKKDATKYRPEDTEHIKSDMDNMKEKNTIYGEEQANEVISGYFNSIYNHLIDVAHLVRTNPSAGDEVRIYPKKGVNPDIIPDRLEDARDEFKGRMFKLENLSTGKIDEVSGQTFTAASGKTITEIEKSLTEQKKKKKGVTVYKGVEYVRKPVVGGKEPDQPVVGKLPTEEKGKAVSGERRPLEDDKRTLNELETQANEYDKQLRELEKKVSLTPEETKHESELTDKLTKIDNKLDKLYRTQEDITTQEKKLSSLNKQLEDELKKPEDIRKAGPIRKAIRHTASLLNDLKDEAKRILGSESGQVSFGRKKDYEETLGKFHREQTGKEWEGYIYRAGSIKESPTEGIYFATSPEVSERFAKHIDEPIRKYRIPKDLENVFYINKGDKNSLQKIKDLLDKDYNPSDQPYELVEKIIPILKKQGYDAVITRGIQPEGGDTELILLKPRKITEVIEPKTWFERATDYESESGTPYMGYLESVYREGGLEKLNKVIDEDLSLFKHKEDIINYITKGIIPKIKPGKVREKEVNILEVEAKRIIDKEKPKTFSEGLKAKKEEKLQEISSDVDKVVTEKPDESKLEPRKLFGNEIGTVNFELDPTKVKDIKRDWYDRFIDIKDNKEVYQEARLLAGKMIGQAEKLMREFYDEILKDVNNKDLNIINKIYKLNAQIHWDRAGKTTEGVTEQMAIQGLEKIRKSIGNKQYDKYSGIVDKIADLHNDKLLDTLVEGEVITPELAKILREKIKVYLRTEFLDDVLSENSGVPFGVREAFAYYDKSFLKTKSGTDRRIKEDLIELTRKSIVQKVVASQKQHLINNILDKFGTKVGIDIDGPDAKESITLRNNKVPLGQEILNLNTRSPNDEQIKWIIENFSKKIESTDPEWIKRNVRIKYAVDNNIVNMMKGLNVENIDIITKVMGGYNKIFRLAATTWRLPFVINNIARDTWNGLFLDRVPDAQMSRITAMAKGFKEAVSDALGMKAETYAKYKEAGGGFGGIATSLNEEVRVPLRLLDTKEKIVRVGKDVVMAPINLISDLAKIGENTTRMMGFIRAKSAGLSDKESAFLARDLTVDFQKYGDKMRVLNTYVPFLNASVQGNINYVRMIKDNPKVAMTRIMYLAVAPYVALKTWNTMFGKTDDDIPPYIKNNYWYMIVPDFEELKKGNYKAKTITTDDGQELPLLLSIRQAELISALVSYIDPVVNAHIRKDEEWVKRNKNNNVVRSLLASTYNVGKNAVVGSMPPLISAGQELSSNYMFWASSPIVPEYQSGLEPKYQSRPSTTNIPRRIGEKIDVSPAKLEYAITKLLPATQQVLALSSPLFESKEGGTQNYAINSTNLEQISKFIPFIKVPGYKQTTTSLYQWKGKDTQKQKTAGYLYKQAIDATIKAKTPEEQEKANKDIDYVLENYGEYLSAVSRNRLKKSYIKSERLKAMGGEEEVLMKMPAAQRRRYFAEQEGMVTEEEVEVPETK